MMNKSITSNIINYFHYFLNIEDKIRTKKAKTQNQKATINKYVKKAWNTHIIQNWKRIKLI